MTEIERIGDQLERAFDGDAWYGNSLISILTGVTAEKAAARPFEQALSVWELVQHIIFTEEVMCRRLTGENALISGNEDFPTVADMSEEAWQETLENLRRSHEKLKAIIKELNDEQLDEAVEGREHSKYFLIHGLIQHLVYHSGQIALINKFLNCRA